MSRELEERLERALSQVVPGDVATEQARAGAMDALPRGLRARHRAALLIAAAVTVLALTGGTLAASETAREVVGISEPKAPAPPEPREAPLPAGASGFATVIGQRIWLSHPGAKEPSRARFTAFELSPNAVYVAAGRGQAIVALEPATLEPVKRHRVKGTVTAISWAPIGIQIAYVVRTPKGSALHLMEGNFTNDRIVARDVAGVKPSWRWDSLAVAYARSDGSVRVLDLGAARTDRIRRPRCAVGHGVSQVAFAPSGGLLAVAGLLRSDAWIADTGGRGAAMCVKPRTTLVGGGVAWLGQRDLVVAVGRQVTRAHILDAGIGYGRPFEAPAEIRAIAASPDRRNVAVALGDGRVVVLGPTSVRQVLLRLAEMPAEPVALLWR